MADARIDYVELPSATAHELTRAFYAKAFGWDVHRLRADLFGDDQRRRPTSACRAIRPTRLSAPLPVIRVDDLEAAFDAVTKAGGDDRQADLQLPRRPALPFHRPVGKRARGVERDLAATSRPRMRADAIATVSTRGLLPR